MYSLRRAAGVPPASVEATMLPTLSYSIAVDTPSGSVTPVSRLAAS